MIGVSEMRLAVIKLTEIKLPVLLALFISLVITAGAQDAPMSPDEASQDASSSFDAKAFFGGSGTGASVPSGSVLPGDNATASTTAAGSASPTDSVFIPSLRPTSGLVFTGEATTDLAYSISEPFNNSARSGSYNGASSLRLDAIGGDRNEAKIEASVIVRMIYGDAAGNARAEVMKYLIPALGGPSPDATTAAGTIMMFLIGADGPVMTVDFNKLYLSVYMPIADISVGRMIVNYGRGTVFSPVDLFSGVDTADIALGRTGNDALRVLVPFGNFSGLDLVSTIASSPEQFIAGGRLFGHAVGWDFGLSAFRDGSANSDGDLVIGLDLKGDVELGVSAEALARLPFAAGTPDPSEAVYSLMAGLDYSIKRQWFFDLEYLWNIRAGQAYPVGGFRREHNLFASLSWKPDDLTALDVRAILVPVNALGQVSLGVSRSIAKGASLMGFAVFRNGNVEGLPDSPLDDYEIDAAALSLGARLSVVY